MKRVKTASVLNRRRLQAWIHINFKCNLMLLYPIDGKECQQGGISFGCGFQMKFKEFHAQSAKVTAFECFLACDFSSQFFRVKGTLRVIRRDFDFESEFVILWWDFTRVQSDYTTISRTIKKFSSFHTRPRLMLEFLSHWLELWTNQKLPANLQPDGQNAFWNSEAGFLVLFGTLPTKHQKWSQFWFFSYFPQHPLGVKTRTGYFWM